MDNSNTFTGFMYAASKDIAAIEALAHAGLHEHCEAITFHCQQAAEKMIKAVYVENGQTPTKSHDVGDLLTKAINLGWIKTSDEVVQAAVDITLYAVVARYETSPDISDGEAKKAIQDCNSISTSLYENGYESIQIVISESTS